MRKLHQKTNYDYNYEQMTLAKWKKDVLWYTCLTLQAILCKLPQEILWGFLQLHNGGIALLSWKIIELYTFKLWNFSLITETSHVLTLESILGYSSKYTVNMQLCHRNQFTC